MHYVRRVIYSFQTSKAKPTGAEPVEEETELQEVTLIQNVESPSDGTEGRDQVMVKPEVPDIHLQVKADPGEQGADGHSTGK